MNNKRAVSIRMTAADIRDVKKLAKRLSARDSDVIRFAVKVMLGRLAPLHDLQVRGKSLVPVFVEFGTDIFRYFELDAIRLDAIINEGSDPDSRVEHDDIQLIAMNGIQQSYARLRLSSLASNGKGPPGRTDKSADSEELGSSLRRYLYEKYVYRNGTAHRGALEMESHHES